MTTTMNAHSYDLLEGRNVLAVLNLFCEKKNHSIECVEKQVVLIPHELCYPVFTADDGHAMSETFKVK